jgi:hypothetical protein
MLSVSGFQITTAPLIGEGLEHFIPFIFPYIEVDGAPHSY